MHEVNISWIKRQAKSIKKKKNIIHSKALDIAAQESGFNNWKHLLKSQAINKGRINE